MIVDPHDDTRDLYTLYLKWAGLNATAVRTAVDALRMMSDYAPDAVVTSLRLPDMDGFALCDAFLAISGSIRPPVIALSTCLPDYERAVRDTRFAAVLMKPCLPVQLLGSIRQVLTAANPDPRDGDLVVTRESAPVVRYAISQYPSVVQFKTPTRDDAIRLARSFAREHAVDVWYSEWGTVTRLETYRPMPASRASVTAREIA